MERSKPMTVSEMIDGLAKLPPDGRLYVSGYEGGYHDATVPDEEMVFVRNVNDEWYYGPHDDADIRVGEPEPGYFIGAYCGE